MADLESLFSDAMAAYARGDYDEARKGFTDLLTVRPAASELHLNLGNVHYQQKRMDQAEACFRKAMELDPMEANAYLNLGNLYFAQQRFEEAASFWEAYKKLNRTNSNVWLNLGLAYDRLNEPVLAMAQYAIFLGSNPSSPDALRIKQRYEQARRMFENNVKVAEEYLQRGDRARARDILEKALAAYPGTAKLYKTYASLLYQNSQWDEALDYYRRAWLEKPDDPAVLVNMGVLYEKRGRPALALWAYHQAKALPGRDQARVAQRFDDLRKRDDAALRAAIRDELSRAQTLLRQGKLQQAEALLSQLETVSGAINEARAEVSDWLDRARDAQDPARKAAKTYMAKGQDAEAHGQFDQAMQFYQKYLALRSDGEQAEEARRRLHHIRTVMTAVVQGLLDQS